VVELADVFSLSVPRFCFVCTGILSFGSINSGIFVSASDCVLVCEVVCALVSRFNL